MYIYIYVLRLATKSAIFIYIYMCVCVTVNVNGLLVLLVASLSEVSNPHNRSIMCMCIRTKHDLDSGEKRLTHPQMFIRAG